MCLIIQVCMYDCITYIIYCLYPCITKSTMIVFRSQSVLCISGNASITNGIATVTVNGLECGITYTIIAGGILNGDLVGPRSSQGSITELCLSSEQGSKGGDGSSYQTIHAWWPEASPCFLEIVPAQKLVCMYVCVFPKAIHSYSSEINLLHKLYKFLVC